MPGRALFDHYGIVFKNCIIENNVALRIIQLQGNVLLNDTIIRNNISDEGAITPENENYIAGKIMLVGNNYVYGNRSNAQIDENGYPLLENGELIGGSEANIVINGALDGRDVQDSFVIYNIVNSCIGISFSGEENLDILNGVEPAVYFGKKVKKPIIGDALRDIEPKDIRRANWLMYGSEILLFILGIGIRVLLLKIAGV